MPYESENRQARKILPARSTWKGTGQITELAPDLLPDQPSEERQIGAWVERPTWIEVDLSAIANNTRLIQSRVGPRVSVLACLKADTYGHGAVNVARTVLRHGAERIGVAMVSEARQLREAGINAPLHILGETPSWQMYEAVHLDLIARLSQLVCSPSLHKHWARPPRSM